MASLTRPSAASPSLFVFARGRGDGRDLGRTSFGVETAALAKLRHAFVTEPLAIARNLALRFCQVPGTRGKSAVVLAGFRGFSREIGGEIDQAKRRGEHTTVAINRATSRAASRVVNRVVNRVARYGAGRDLRGTGCVDALIARRTTDGDGIVGGVTKPRVVIGISGSSGTASFPMAERPRAALVFELPAPTCRFLAEVA